MNKWIYILIIVVLVLGSALFFWQFYGIRIKPNVSPSGNLNVNQPLAPQSKITNFDECAAAGNPIMESYPAQCRTPEGQVFIEDIGNELEKLDLIVVDTPRPNTVIKSPLQITGRARGIWFFEASFPVKLLDGNNNLLAITPAQAKDEWMTQDFVPFEATLEFEMPTTSRGTLILEKDNPTGLPEYDDSLIIPIRFSK